MISLSNSVFDIDVIVIVMIVCVCAYTDISRYLYKCIYSVWICIYRYKQGYLYMCLYNLGLDETNTVVIYGGRNTFEPFNEFVRHGVKRVDFLLLL